MLMPGRTYSAGSGYRYGFNGQEKSDEIAGTGNHTTAEFWEYDARLGKRWNVDPVTKAYESSYATFGNNPICNIDPNGADTINITRTTTTIRMKGRSDGHSDNLATQSRSLTSVSGNINIKAASGLDVFMVTDVNVTVNEDGRQFSTSHTTTLDVRGEGSLYRNGGHNMKGFADDRYALASMVPTWMLDHYANKNKNFDTPTEWGLGAAKAYQKDVPFVAALQKISNAAYVITGAYGMVRMTLAAAVPAVTEEGSFFTGTRYTSKVFKQMNSDYYHGFPESVKAFENYGIRSTIVGGDGVKREMLRIPGLYGEKGGFFEFIKEADGSINHRVFMPLVR
jgi:hypothetical protein